MKLNITGANEQILKGISEISGLLGITQSQSGIPVRVYKTGKGLSVKKEDNRYAIGYDRPVEFYRALGILAESLKKGSDININQTPNFEINGLMLDCSRNAVPKVSTVKNILRYMALMGLSTLQLYTEDTFEVKDYPYFGYMRGRFTADEIKECDTYARMFGIELIPCVQTLAHFNQAMRWKFMAEMTDHDDILLIGDEKTYKFLDAMIGSIASMYTSRRINIGMDEAHMVGLGNYLLKNGYQNRFEIMTKHLARVLGR